MTTTRVNQPSLKRSIIAALAFVAVVWAIHIAQLLTGSRWVGLGIYPGELANLWGIIYAPLIHGSMDHLLSNTLPLLLLGSMLVYGYPRSRWRVLVITWLLSGLGVWLFARPSLHFGASGLTHGMFFFLLIGGFLRRDRRSLVLLAIAFFMYGGMLLTIFPQEPGISYEYHFFGAASGALCAFLFRRADAIEPRRLYAWESDAGADPLEDDPVIGDQWMTESQREAQERTE